MSDRIVPNIPWLTPIVLPMPAGQGTVNVYLIRTSDGTALIDTGHLETVCVNSLISELKHVGLVLADIDQVVLTHHHVDHSGAAAQLKAAGAQIYISETDAAHMAAFYQSDAEDEALARCYEAHPLPESLLVLVNKMFAFMRRIGAPVVIDAPLTHGQTIELAGLTFQVLMTPGHTPGHLCLHNAKEGVLFTGDTLLSPNAVHISGKRGDTNPLKDLLSSLDMIDGLSGVVVYPGHGRPVVDVALKVATLKSALEAGMSRIASRVSFTPKSAFELTDAILTDPRSRAFSKWLAFTKAVAYLDYLAAANRVRRIQESGSLKYHRIR